MRQPRFHCTALLALALLAPSAAPPPASAGWGPDGATIKSTSLNIPKLAACNDGAYGSFVVWQEETSPGGGVVRAQHVLATGDVDPAWPADGALLCGFSTARHVIGVVPDRLGGAYAWWKEGPSIYMTRVDAAGAVAANWPARGRVLGSTFSPTAIPSVIEDGAHGVYAGWASTAVGQTDPISVLLIHLGPGNTGAGGWPNNVRAAAGGDPTPTFDYWPSLALAPDGGVFVAWAGYSLDPDAVSSAFRLRRLTPAGLNAAGWPMEGLSLGEFHGELLDSEPGGSLLSLSEDERGGVFALIGKITEFNGGVGSLESRLLRIKSDGTQAPEWPAAGVWIPSGGIGVYWDQGPDASYRVMPDGLGGALVGQPAYFDHGTRLGFEATFENGAFKWGAGVGGEFAGSEVARASDGGMFLASFYPKGAYGPYEPNAYLSVTRSLAPPAWTDFLEYHPEIVVTFFGDIGLAESGDGGAVFFWSQVRERFGLFARRFNAQGAVTGVTPSARVTALGLSRSRFVAGEGVRLSVSVPAGEASLDLYDVTGRRVAGERIAGEGARELTLAGTRTLPSGLYFARLAAGGEWRVARVSVTR